jgi:hypothetical protein
MGRVLTISLTFEQETELINHHKKVYRRSDRLEMP